MATSTVSTNPPGTKKVKNPKPRKLFIVLVFLLLLGGVGAATGYYFNAPSKPAAAPPPVNDPFYVALAPMTVNLRPNDPHNFLHVGVTLKVVDAKAQAMVTQYLPEVTSRLQLLLSNRQSDSLVTSTDKAKLAAEALNVLSQPFGPNQPALKISSVMFPVFMLQ